MAETAVIKIKIRTGNSEDWAIANPVLLEGEIGFDTESKILFIGNGVDNYEALTANNAYRLTSIALLNSSFNLLQSDINNESTTRANADTAISATITTLNGSVTTLSSTVGTLSSDLSALSTAFNTWFGEISAKGQIPIVSESLGRLSLLNAGSNGQALIADDTKDQGMEWKTINDGDMKRATYDANDDGVVDDSERLGGEVAANYALKTYVDAADNSLGLLISGKESSIDVGSTSQYFRGDKTWQTLNKAAVGIGNVDNTSDANKPISTAQAAAIALKEDAITAPADASKFWDGTKAFRVLTTNDIPSTVTSNRKSINYYRRSTLWYSNAINATALSTVLLTANTANAPLHYLVIEETIIITDIAVEVTTAGSAGSTMHFGLYQITNPTSSSIAGTLVAGTVTPQAASTTGLKQLTLPSPLTLTSGVYLCAVSHNSTTAVTMRALSVSAMPLMYGNTTPSGLHISSLSGVRASYAALPSTLAGFTSLSVIASTNAVAFWYKIQ